MRFYTYAHKKLSNGDIFYIGKGTGHRCKSLKSRNRFWLNIVKKHGFVPEILAYWETDAQASAHEQFLIKCFKEKGITLCNLTDGGDGRRGVTNTPEVRAAHSERMKNPELNPSKRPEVLEKFKGENNHMYGKRGVLSPIFGRSREDQRVVLTCPHCEKVGKAAGMRRWHFSHCKMRGEAA